MFFIGVVSWNVQQLGINGVDSFQQHKPEIACRGGAIWFMGPNARILPRDNSNTRRSAFQYPPVRVKLPLIASRRFIRNVFLCQMSDTCRQPIFLPRETDQCPRNKYST